MFIGYYTYAVLQLASGTDIYTVSKMLTHKHVTTTEIYLDLLDEMKEDTLGRIQIHKDPETRTVWKQAEYRPKNLIV